MSRLLASAGVAVALSIASVDAVVPANTIVTLAPSTYDYTEACPSQVWTHLDQVINPNASRSPFVIPAASVFVLTGASWGRNPGTGTGLDIRIRNVVTADLELVAVLPAQDRGGAYAVGAVMLNPGVVVGHDTAICASVSSPEAIGAAGTEVRLYGYFAKTKLKAQAPAVIGR